MNLNLLMMSGVVALVVAGCGEGQASQPPQTDADVASQPPSPAGVVDGRPLWRVSMAYGTLTAIDRPASTTTPDAPVDADLWIISDMQGGFDTMQIAATIDCQARTYAFNQITSYTGADLVETAPASDASAHPANPDTPYADAIGHVCDAHDAASQTPDYADFTVAQAALAEGR